MVFFSGPKGNGRVPRVFNTDFLPRDRCNRPIVFKRRFSLFFAPTHKIFIFILFFLSHVPTHTLRYNIYVLILRHTINRRKQCTLYIRYVSNIPILIFTSHYFLEKKNTKIIGHNWHFFLYWGTILFTVFPCESFIIIIVSSFNDALLMSALDKCTYYKHWEK